MQLLVSHQYSWQPQFTVLQEQLLEKLENNLIHGVVHADFIQHSTWRSLLPCLLWSSIVGWTVWRGTYIGKWTASELLKLDWIMAGVIFHLHAQIILVKFVVNQNRVNSSSSARPRLQIHCMWDPLNGVAKFVNHGEKKVHNRIKVLGLRFEFGSPMMSWHDLIRITIYLTYLHNNKKSWERENFKVFEKVTYL